MWMKIRNTFIIFLVSGFWHGANWTFIIWGLLHALYIMPSIIFNTNRNHLDIVAQGKLLPSFNELFSMIFTFSLTVFAWIFFRAQNVQHAFSFIYGIFTKSFFTIPTVTPLVLIAFIGFFIIIEWIGRQNQYAIAHFGSSWPKILRWSFYYFILAAIFYFNGAEQQFIYFQF